jgi:hypothetical protein
MFASYLLLADALRRIYKNFVSDLNLNTKLIFSYFTNTIFYFSSLMITSILFLVCNRNFEAVPVLTGELITNLASELMTAVLVVIFWKIIDNIPSVA